MQSGIHPRIVKIFPPGSSTATPSNVEYRLSKLVGTGLLKGRWLDYGCAEGGYTVGLASRGATSAVGFDVLRDRIAVAKSRHRGMQSVQFLSSSDGQVPVNDDYFDGVFINEVMEHVTDEEKTMAELNRVLRAGGHLVVVGPNRWFPFECHGARFGRLNLAFPVPLLPWLPSALGQRFMRARNYWPKELAELVHNFGFEIESVGFVWPVFEVYPWLPGLFIRLYRKQINIIDSLPLFRRFGVSTLVIGKKIKSVGT